MVVMGVRDWLDDRALMPSVRALMGRSDGAARLVALLDDPAIRNGIAVRGQAARALGEMGEVAAVEPIARLLANDGLVGVRAFAAIALGRIASVEGVMPLVNALQDEQYSVRYHAAASLGRIGDARALPALCAALHDSSWTVRTSAAEALGHLHDAAAIPALVDAALRPRFRVRQHSRVRMNAIEAVQRIGGPAGSEALAQLRRRIHNPFWWRIIRVSRHRMEREAQASAPAGEAAPVRTDPRYRREEPDNSS
jgi:HEAT repeat protein